MSKIEKVVVNGYKKVEDKFVDTFLKKMEKQLKKQKQELKKNKNN